MVHFLWIAITDQTEVDNSPSDRVSTAGRVSAGPGNKDGSKESESNENLEVTKSRADVRPAATCSESVDGAFEIRVVEAEIHSGSVTSGLSSSTDSLTDVSSLCSQSSRRIRLKRQLTNWLRSC